MVTASASPDRVLGVLVCCGMTDMSWANEVTEARMEGALAIWQSADRDAAIAIAVEQFGQNGEKRFIPNPDAPLTLRFVLSFLLFEHLYNALTEKRKIKSEERCSHSLMAIVTIPKQRTFASKVRKNPVESA